ncbi:MAG TPA: outer membrane lipoprotein carrier protein LolA [Steroidobacteraceae bacterium]|jgi:hypothetical protein|nr:outer membrane lipoprotein carrier protein LolA [Steroidobacteraceae bacterium]
MSAPRRLRLIAGAALLCVPAWRCAQGAPAADSAGALDQVMSLFAQRRHAEASFTEEKYLSVLRHPISSSGRLIYEAPDHLEERTLTPRPQSVVLDHGLLSMKIGQRLRTLRLADYPQLAPLIDSIRATLAGDRAQLERAFSLEFSGDAEHWQLHLRPLDAHSPLTQIDLSGARDEVNEVRMQQRDGDHSVMRISSAE